jgi:phosphatidylglycerophosphatase A
MNGVVSSRRPTVAFMLAHPARWIALGFGSGLAPRAPGTVGTLWAWLSFLVLDRWLDAAQWGWLLLGGLLVGWWACTQTARALGQADPGAIVWDEIIAFWAVLWLAMPMGFWGQLIAFGLFRFFDAAKPGPVRWADRLFPPEPTDSGAPHTLRIDNHKGPSFRPQMGYNHRTLVYVNSHGIWTFFERFSAPYQCRADLSGRY